MGKRAHFQRYPWGYGSSSLKCLQCGTHQGDFQLTAYKQLQIITELRMAAAWIAGRALPWLSPVALGSACQTC